LRYAAYHIIGFLKTVLATTATNHLWKPTLAQKWFPLHGNGFSLQGNFGQNLKSCFQPKIFEMFFKLYVGNNYMQSKPTNFYWNIVEQIKHQ
jgi:hypothetical protein